MDHSLGRDIAVHPDTEEGRALAEFYTQNNIPFRAFRGAHGIITGPHIHEGPDSVPLGTLPPTPDLSDLFEPEVMPQAGEVANDEVLTVNARADVAKTVPRLRPKKIDIYSTEGRAERDALKAAEGRADARRLLELQLPPGKTSWDEVTSEEASDQAVRQFAAERGIDPQFLGGWLKANPGHIYERSTGEKKAPADYIYEGSPFYDFERRTLRVSSEMPRLKKLEDDYNAAKSLAARGRDWLLDERRTAGEKFLDVAQPVASGAMKAAEVASRPLAAVDAQFWSRVNRPGVGNKIAAVANPFDPQAMSDAAAAIRGEAREGARNPIAQAARDADVRDLARVGLAFSAPGAAELIPESVKLRDINPNLPAAVGFAAEALTSPSNAIPAGAVRAALRGTGRGARLLTAAEDVATGLRRPLPARPLGLTDDATRGAVERAAELSPPRQWQHADFGLVTEAENQAGIKSGRVRVRDEQGAEHVIRRANGAGAGNQRAIPVRQAARTPATEVAAVADLPDLSELFEPKADATPEAPTPHAEQPSAPPPPARLKAEQAGKVEDGRPALRAEPVAPFSDEQFAQYKREAEELRPRVLKKDGNPRQRVRPEDKSRWDELTKLNNDWRDYLRRKGEYKEAQEVEGRTAAAREVVARAETALKLKPGDEISISNNLRPDYESARVVFKGYKVERGPFGQVTPVLKGTHIRADGTKRPADIPLWQIAGVGEPGKVGEGYLRLERQAADVGDLPPRRPRSLPQSLEGAGLEGGESRFYEVKSNVQSEEAARQIIRERGVENSINWVKAADAPSAEHSATALELVKGLSKEARAARDANPEVAAAKLAQAVEVASAMSVKSTEAGQAIQYLSTLARETPEGAVLYAQKAIQRVDPDARLTGGQAKALTDAAEKISALEKHLEELAQKLETRRAPAQRPKATDRLREWADKAEAEGREALRAKLGRLSSGVPVDAIPDLAKVGAAKIARGAANFADWQKAMLEEFGEAIRPHLEEVRRLALRQFTEQREAVRRESLVDRLTGGKPGDFTPAQIEELIKLDQARRSQGAKARAGFEREIRGLEPTALMREIRRIGGENDLLVAGASKFTRPEAARGAWRREMAAEHGLSAKELPQLEAESFRLYRDARAALKEQSRIRAATGDAPEGLSSDAIRQLVAQREKALRERGQARRELWNMLRSFERPKPSPWRRLNNVYRGQLVTQVATSMRNVITQALRVGVESVTDALELAIVKAKQKVGLKVREGDIDPRTRYFDTLLPSLYLFQRNKRVAQGILDEFPSQYEELFRSYASDVTVPDRGPVGRGADKVLTRAEQAVEATNFINRFQEFGIRRAVFLGKLQQRLRARGLDAEKLFSAGRASAIPKEDIEAAVKAALETTFAASPRRGSAGEHFIGLANSIPAPINPAMFSRYLYNAFKFSVEYHPLAVLKPLAGRPFTSRDAAKALTGTVMLLTADQIMVNLHDENDPWWMLRVPFSDEKFDARPFQPFSGYLFQAYNIRRALKGQELASAKEFPEGLLGISNRPNPAVDVLRAAPSAVSGDEPSRQKVATVAKRAAGETVAGFLMPLKTAKDVIAQFDAEERIQRDVSDQPFLGPIKRSVPFAARGLPPRKVDGKVPSDRAPLLKQVTGVRLIDQVSEPSPALRAARELRKRRMGDLPLDEDRMKRVRALKDRARGGEDVADELDALVQSGTLSPQSASRIGRAAEDSPLQEVFRDLTLEEAEKVFKLARPEEKEQLREILEEKRKRKSEQRERGYAPQ